MLDIFKKWFLRKRPSQKIIGMLDTLKKATPVALAAIQEEMRVRKTNEVFLIFSEGSQFDHLVYQRAAKRGVYCLVADPAKVTAEDVLKVNPKGIVITGGPASVHSEPPPFNRAIFDLGIPVLGICLGGQMIAQHVGVTVKRGRPEYSVHNMQVLSSSVFFRSCPKTMKVMQSHGDEIENDPRLELLGSTGEGRVSAFRSIEKPYLYGVQFHPEVTETLNGDMLFENFFFGICGAQDRFPAEKIAKKKIAELKAKLKEGKKVTIGLSGGADSSTVVHLLKEAVDGGPHRIQGVYIKGIDRPDDEAFVLKYFANQPWLDLVIVDATEQFLKVLAWPEMKHFKKIRRAIRRLLGMGPPVTMRAKRLAMRVVYKAILEEQARAYGSDFIAQGTLYTDISESGGGHESGARKAVIKIHHNTFLGFYLPELTPLDDCVKDGGRDIGREIGVPEELLLRHPFPGVGLIVRIEGEITREKLAMARQLDGIYIEELRRANLYHLVWQAGVVVTISEHTVTKGDDAGMGVVVVYWAVWSVNGFTAQAVDVPYEFHQTIQRRFGNEVRGIGATACRTSNKPYTTIEWG